MTTYVPLSELRVGDTVRISQEVTVVSVGAFSVVVSSGEQYGYAFFDKYQAEVISHDSVRSRILALPVGSIFTLDRPGYVPPRPRRTFLKTEKKSVLELEDKNTFNLTPPGMFTSCDLDQFTVLYEGTQA